MHLVPKTHKEYEVDLFFSTRSGRVHSRCEMLPSLSPVSSSEELLIAIFCAEPI